MNRITLLLVAMLPLSAVAAPKKDKKEGPTVEQKEADRHFKSGVELYKEGKVSEALAEFERAYEIAPHPLVLFNIATCYRDLSFYGKAVHYYERFLAEGKGKVPPARLKEAQSDLDTLNGRIARVSVKITGPADTKLSLDGKELSSSDETLMVAPGEHKLVARAPGHKDAEKTVRVASGDRVEAALVLEKLEPLVVNTRVERTDPTETTLRVEAPLSRKRFMLGAAYGTNLLLFSETGAPTLGLGFAVHPRIEIGVDAVVVAYAVMPNVRVRLAGDKLGVHATVAMPVSFTDGEMSETFIAGAAGLGLRFRATPALALRLESLVSFGTKDRGTTLPTFLGGELWF